MRIGFYITNIKHSDGGIYQYSIYVLKMLIKCSEVNEIVVFLSKEQKETFQQLLSHPKIKSVYNQSNNLIYRFFKKTAEFYMTRYYLTNKRNSHLLSLYKIFNPDRWFLNKFDLDLLHVPRQHSPAYLLKFPVVITMHDVQHFHFPEFFSPIERIYKSLSYYTSLCECEHVIVSYKHIKEDIVKYFPLTDKQVSVCPVPMDQDWVSEDEETKPMQVKVKYNIPDQFILTPAATWEHKNHLAVIEAISILRSEGFKVFWVATGNKTNFYDKIENRIKELNLSDQIKFTGIVSDIELKELFKIASLVVIPTLYEAGSGPLFESIRYGTPVICSNVTSLPETIDNGAYIFDPHDHKQIAELIKKMLTDADFVNENKINSKRLMNQFINNNYCDQFISTYKSVISNNITHPKLN